jgi:serine/threonine-protein kinase PRP4
MLIKKTFSFSLFLSDGRYKAGMDELVILKKLVAADPEDRRHCVRFISSFKYRNHLCLVFESLHMNLREVLKKFGRNIGLKLTAVRAYAKQLFIALKHLRNCGVLHCDIKPDNMLVLFYIRQLNLNIKVVFSL